MTKPVTGVMIRDHPRIMKCQPATPPPLSTASSLTLKPNEFSVKLKRASSFQVSAMSMIESPAPRSAITI